MLSADVNVIRVLHENVAARDEILHLTSAWQSIQTALLFFVVIVSGKRQAPLLSEDRYFIPAFSVETQSFSLNGSSLGSISALAYHAFLASSSGPSPSFLPGLGCFLPHLAHVKT